jgi:hypothetical protein
LIEGGGFTVTGSASISGTGVTIYNTSSTYPSSTGSYGGLTLSGNGTFSLTAPASGLYAGLVIFQPSANTRAISLSGNAAQGLGGTVYAPAALLSLGSNATVNGALVVNQLSLSGNAASTQAVDNSDVSGGSTAGQLLAGDLLVYVNDPSGLFTADELARIQDAVSAVDAVVEPYGVSVAETTDPTLANVVIDTGSTSAAGGYADGILGCYTTTGEITLIQGWNWYAGSDPTQVGANQYDFETTVTHELGHALGLGESSDPTSAMYGTLATGTTIRTLTTADLNIPYDEAGADAQRAAVSHLAPAADLASPGPEPVSPADAHAGRPLAATLTAHPGEFLVHGLMSAGPDANRAWNVGVNGAASPSLGLDLGNQTANLPSEVPILVSRPAERLRAGVATIESGAAADSQEPQENPSWPPDGAIPAAPATNPALSEQAIDVLLAGMDPAPGQRLPSTGMSSTAAVESVFVGDAAGKVPVLPAIDGHQSETRESAAVDAGWAWVGVLGLLLNPEVQGRRDRRPRGRRLFTA